MATRRYASNQNMERDPHGLYVVGSLAVERKQAPKIEQEQRPQIHVVRQKKRAVSQNRQLSFVSKLIMTCAVFAVFACGFLLVDKLAAISQNNSIIEQKQQELEDLTRYGEQLEVELAMSQDLNSVMVTAREDLGMAAPQQQMRREVVLGMPDAEGDTQTAQQQEEGFDIMAMLSKITEFLH